MDEKRKREIGQRLREARGNASLLTFSAQVGSNKTSWANYESGKQAPDLHLLIRVQALTGISLDWLATGEGKPSAPIDAEALTGIVRAIEAETPNIDADSKAKLILRFYEDRQKLSLPAASDARPKKAAG